MVAKRSSSSSAIRGEAEPCAAPRPPAGLSITKSFQRRGERWSGKPWHLYQASVAVPVIAPPPVLSARAAAASIRGQHTEVGIVEQVAVALAPGAGRALVNRRLDTGCPS